MITFGRWASSLRFRLLAATLAALALALLLAGVWLSGLFREHVMRQFEAALTLQLDQLTTQLELDASGQPVIDPQQLSDPRWRTPYSGLYWQLDQVSGDGAIRSGVLRSRSLWDTTLPLSADALANGTVHVHEGSGPQGAAVLMLERTVALGEQPGVRWRLIVAAETRQALEAVDRFTGVLSISLLVLGALLALAAVTQVAVGLSPLRGLQHALVQVREGRSARLQGRFPSEVQPLIDDFNGVLDRNAEVVARARTQAGNLAHALKTPLAVLGQAATQALNAGDPANPRDTGPALARLVHEQVDTARRHIDWHLAHARAAAAERLPGLRTPVAPVVLGLVRVMQRVHAERHIDIDASGLPDTLAFAGEEQDLQEMLGNLIDNACKWARHTVVVSASSEAGRLCLRVEDDGPGIDDQARAAVLARGARLDESVPGSGLGLAIVTDLARLYGGDVRLETARLGGLGVALSLPAAD
ncbi:sensor histidine kinase [Hydrogenophaga aromaticivorans]|uniref:histidine kinase n=1 Tax=Hydrogenophaga aromaticivorans TaxID=2610898 RepID=A0A7Y8GSZ2_9BURK|nr:sensor histidine kinase [Hydrogenophaga aromaticivorans]MBQ0920030.1 sensor histidine kinase [Hydrogenophaga aromaticivorans]NWF44320.1 sensor histidine kinase [Hydrogenophaga aromaticivorans]